MADLNFKSISEMVCTIKFKAAACYSMCISAYANHIQLKYLTYQLKSIYHQNIFPCTQPCKDATFFFLMNGGMPFSLNGDLQAHNLRRKISLCPINPRNPTPRFYVEGFSLIKSAMAAAKKRHMPAGKEYKGLWYLPGKGKHVENEWG